MLYIKPFAGMLAFWLMLYFVYSMFTWAQGIFNPFRLPGL